MNRLAAGTHIWVVLVLAVALLATPVFAQDDGEGDEAEAAETAETFAEELTVTSRKREEAIQNVPFSVVAPTEQVLRDRGAETLEDISSNVAGFSVQNLGPGQSQVAIRGISGGQVVRDQPGVKEQVGVYLDESVLSLSLFTPDIDLFDMNRVEVLRGPQGTLFGSGSLSGTVRYISNQPILGVQESVAELSLSTITDGEVGGSAKVATNVPLGESSALRVAAYHTSYGGYMDAVQPVRNANNENIGLTLNEDVNSGERTGVRLALQFAPSDTVTVTPRLLYQEISMDGWNRIDKYNILANPFTTTRPAVTLGERQLFTQIPEPYTDDFLLFDVNVQAVLGDLLLTSVTSFTDRDILVVRDATALTASITGGTIPFPEPIYNIDAPLDDATTVETITQELRLSGGGVDTNWVVGLFYSTIERDYGQSLIVPGFENLSGIPTQGLRAQTDELFFSDLDYDFDQVALFGEVNYQVSDSIEITGGLRFYDFEENRSQVFDGIFGNDDNGVSLVSRPGSISADGFAPRVIASFEVSDRTTVNAQVSKGFRLGGINDPLNVPLCTPQDLAIFGGLDNWKDEEVWNYEVGAKSSVGNAGYFNVAAYYMDISDLQATVTAGSCSSRIIFNVPEARSSGLELELGGRPSEAFDYAISASYNDSELQSEAAGAISGISKGRRLPTVPEFQAAAAATYRWDVNDRWGGYASGVFQHVGSRFTQVGDFASGFGTVNLLALGGVIGGPLTQTVFRFNPELPSYNLLNLRVGIQDEVWDVALFVNNVTDEIAFLALDQERGTLARVGFLTNQPRTIGVNARVKF